MARQTWEPKEVAAERFGRKQKFSVCSVCEERIDQFGCACNDDMEIIRKAERRNEEVLETGYWSPFDMIQEY